MSLENLFIDLISVPGLRMVICFERNEQPVVHHIGAENNQEAQLSKAAQERILRGVSPVVRQLRGASARVELRGEHGRFIIRSLGSGSSLVCVTNNFLNLPLLELALDAYAKAAEEDADAVLQTFRRGEVAQLFEEIPHKSSVKSFSSIKMLQEKVRQMESAQKPEEQPANVISFAVSAPPAASFLPPFKPLTPETPAPFQPAAAPPTFQAPMPVAVAAPPPVPVVVSSPTPPPAPVHQPTPLPVAPLVSYTPPHAPVMIAPPAAPISAASPLIDNCTALALALSEVSAQSVKFLGRSVVANYWKQTQPEGLHGLYEISMDGNIRALKPEEGVSREQFDTARAWAKKFLERCSFIVTDISVEISKTLSGAAAALLNTKGD